MPDLNTCTEIKRFIRIDEILILNVINYLALDMDSTNSVD